MRLEAASALNSVGAGSAQVALGGVLALLGAIAIFTGLILLAGDQWLRDRYWLAALIVTVVLALAAGWLVTRGMKLLSPERLAPEETFASLKEDTRWLRQQLKSGATSS